VSGPHAEQIRQTFAALQKYHGPELAKGVVSADQIDVAFLLGNLKYNSYILAISVGAVFFGPTLTRQRPRILWSKLSPTTRRSTPPTFPRLYFQVHPALYAAHAGDCVVLFVRH